MSAETKLPPGQYELEEFPRFGLSQFAKRFPKGETHQIQPSSVVRPINLLSR
jgi:hypothetical protein